MPLLYSRPDKVIRQFQTVLVNLNPKELDFNRAYNKPLDYYFPPGSVFSVVLHISSSVERFCRLHRLLRNFFEMNPFLIIQWKDPAAIKRVSTRAESNDQI